MIKIMKIIRKFEVLIFLVTLVLKFYFPKSVIVNSLVLIIFLIFAYDFCKWVVDPMSLLRRKKGENKQGKSD